MDRLAELVRRAQAGDEAAFDEVVRLTLPGMYGFLRTLGADEEDASDAVQEAYLRAWRAMNRFDSSRRIEPWLYQIARRALYDLYRKQSRSPASLEPTIEIEDAPDLEPLPDALFAKEESRAHVRAALAELGAAERAVLALRYDEELSFEDISISLSMPAGTARSIHHRALAKLRSRLKHLL